MGEREKQEVERLGKLLLLPLADVNVALSLRNTLSHAQKAIERAAESGPDDDVVRRETISAMKDLLTVIHAATGALLAGLDSASQPSGPLQETEVQRPKPTKKKG